MPFLLWITLTLRRAAWAPVLVLALHLFAVLVLGLYQIWPPTDIPMHFLGGIAIAFFFAHAYHAAEELGLLGRPAAVLGEVTVFALVCSATVFWEFAEFLFDRHLGTHLQDGLDDTLGDMLMGLLGGLAFLAGRLVTARRRAR
jgi:peptidoglycan/LPS O-acetylase OafA/YrhL